MTDPETFAPRTGAVIDRICRQEPLDERELALAEWASSRGLSVLFGKAWPEDDEDFEPYFTYDLCVEEMIDGKIHAHWTTLSNANLLRPEIWPLWEKSLRASFERAKAAA